MTGASIAMRAASRTRMSDAGLSLVCSSDTALISASVFSTGVSASVMVLLPSPLSSRGASSDALQCLQPPGPDGRHELLVVLLVAIGVGKREPGDRPVESVVLTEVRRDGDRVAGSRVRPGQGPPADARVEGEPGRNHGLDNGRALHVTKLAPVEVTALVQTPGPAEEDVAGGLHHPLSLHHPFAVLAISARPQVLFQHRGRGLLDLEEERLTGVPALEQGDERPRADAADADHLARRVDDLEAFEQGPAVVLQGGTVTAELFTDRARGLPGRQAVHARQVALGDDDRRLAHDPV